MTTSASHTEVVLVTFVCWGVYKYDPRYVIIFKVTRVWEGYITCVRRLQQDYRTFFPYYLIGAFACRK